MTIIILIDFDANLFFLFAFVAVVVSRCNFTIPQATHHAFWIADEYQNHMI